MGAISRSLSTIRPLSQLSTHALSSTFEAIRAFLTLSQLLARFLNFWHTFLTFRALSHTFSTSCTLFYTFLTFGTLSPLCSLILNLCYTFTTLVYSSFYLQLLSTAKSSSIGFIIIIQISCYQVADMFVDFCCFFNQA